MIVKQFRQNDYYSSHKETVYDGLQNIKSNTKGKRVREPTLAI